MDKRVQRITITVVVITSFISTFTGSALNLSIPNISSEFNVEAGLVGWLITGYTLATAAFSVPLGRLSDITSRKGVLVIGVSLFVACCIATLFSTSIYMLLVFRVIQGFAAAMMFSSNTPVLLSVFPGSMRGKVIGYNIAATYVGLSAGPVVGGILNHNLGWRSIFVVTAILGTIAVVLAAAKLPANEYHGEKRSMDWRGNVIFLAFIILLMYGLSDITGGVVPIVMAIVGAALGIIFVIWESHVDDPVVNIKLFRRDKGYAFSNVSALMNYAATFAISYLISIYLQVVMGYSSQIAGIIMICQPAIMAILSPMMGRFSDKYSPFKMSSLGMALCGIGTFIYIFIDQDTSIGLVICALVVTGLGFSLFSSPNTNAVMSCVDKDDYGVASSILSTMRTIGHTLSMVVVTIMVSVYMGGMSLAEAHPDQVVSVINKSFIVFTIVCIAGVFISLQRKRN